MKISEFWQKIKTTVNGLQRQRFNKTLTKLFAKKTQLLTAENFSVMPLITLKTLTNGNGKYHKQNERSALTFKTNAT